MTVLKLMTEVQKFTAILIWLNLIAWLAVGILALVCCCKYLGWVK